MIKSKRGRKPKNKPIDETLQLYDASGNIIENNVVSKDTNLANVTDPSNNLPKKRGRKPKGGKIIPNTVANSKIVCVMPNIILHLYCTMEDVNNTFNITNTYNPNIINVETYDNYNDDYFKPGFSLLLNNDSEDSKKSEETLYTVNNINNINNIKDNIDKNSNSGFRIDCVNINTISNDKNNVNNKEDENSNSNKNIQKNISKKLKELSYKLHNNICENKSACFWCTCKFNTGNIYIPKKLEEDNIDVYGCFCSPECATSYLMNEHIDTSIKFERYSLLNYVYGSIYNYKKNIKPAPSPFYTLDKYCGNMTIEEYRSHFTDDNLLIIANKPQTRIMPEMFEENSMSNNDIRYSINKYA